MNKHSCSFLFPTRSVFQHAEVPASDNREIGGMSTPESAELEEQVVSLEQRLADLKKVEAGNKYLDRSIADPLIAELGALRQKIESGRSSSIDEARGQLQILDDLVSRNEDAMDIREKNGADPFNIDVLNSNGYDVMLNRYLQKQLIDETEYVRLSNELDFIRKNIGSENSNIKTEASRRFQSFVIDTGNIHTKEKLYKPEDNDYYSAAIVNSSAYGMTITRYLEKQLIDQPEYDRLFAELNFAQDNIASEDPRNRARAITAIQKLLADLDRIHSIEESSK
ncbi:MAG: hypothetical protein ACD_51C00053G0012 [uncultured bacterium]|nr:MAG: hypothetical protein ACD_51C00053G0012 [uncultured bacterium]OGJ46870.1 MAG: hypothetical protein A2244_02960 [Candidatus Peregrinibacteria bacterium RIFOXYA2_FULL_41_18]OGJ48004.1 MAG: hypothetical protein A2344_01805 [Candidatus Peregrinibacteria bacterium RIFOXYB12_FULL_41_12]OGJ53254.1 MAG: hypothetical protein A2448_04290 [Candidatus Peregrinibacteria bacterium RIFOXYC2_FULL_41_22]OGJ54324.1 MAG: hypothetical protein A2336_01315 [Candidatus Peregrinibacteria bacterium RIFOXYB2_FULL